jgi:YD repeat-containing protein
VNGSRTVRILKRDGTSEDFHSHKLAGSIARGMRSCGEGSYRDAVDLAGAISIYVRQGWQCPCISSPAVFEMTLKVLRHVQFTAAADAMEAYRLQRTSSRRLIRIAHADGRVTHWDKGWLARIGAQSWKIGPGTARIIAAEVEQELLASVALPDRATGLQEILLRQDVLELFNRRVAEYGLADAVPVGG